MAGKMISQIGKAGGYATAAAAGLEAAQKLWSVANKDDQLVQAAGGVRERAAAALQARSPLAVLQRELDAADEALAEFVADDDDARAAHERWSREAATLRSKVTPIAGYPAKKQRQTVVDLRRRAEALLDEIVAYGLEPRSRRRLPRLLPRR